MRTHDWSSAFSGRSVRTPLPKPPCSNGLHTKTGICTRQFASSSKIKNGRRGFPEHTSIPSTGSVPLAHSRRTFRTDSNDKAQAPGRARLSSDLRRSTRLLPTSREVPRGDKQAFQATSDRWVGAPRTGLAESRCQIRPDHTENVGETDRQVHRTPT